MVERVGLIGRGKDFLQIPLDSISVKVNIYGILAHFEASLTYTNSTKDPIEVEFKHPLHNESVLIGIEAVIDGRKIKGIVKEKGEAKTEYEDAISSGKTAALVEENSQDILGILLGNLPPGKNATISLQLLQQLDVEQDGIHLLLPTTLKPRYELGGSQAQAPPSYTAMIETVVPAIYKFSFELFLVGEIGKLKQITSPSHKIAEFYGSDGRKGIQVTSPDPLNNDLVVYIDFDDINPLSALIEPPLPERGEKPAQHPYIDNPAVLLTFMPNSHQTDLCGNGEFVFVIDQSGSMSGTPIIEARETLDMLLRSLSPGCYFNIIGFGTSYVSLFPGGSVEYTQVNLDKAVKHVSTLTANLGGTEILQPLQYVFSKKSIPGLTRQLFLLTDGGVSNIDDIVKTVADNSSHTRAFTFGIGSGVSTELVNKVAKAGKGKAVFISSKDRMQARVMEVMVTAMSPSYTDISVTGSKSMVVYPQSIPVLFENEPFVVVGFFNEKIFKGEKITATLKYSSQAETKKTTIQFTLADNVSTHFPNLPLQLVHQFGVSKALRDLEGTISSKDECIILSCYSNIMSKHTSFVAIGEDQHQMIEGSMKMYNVRINTLAYDSPMLGGIPMMCSAAPPPPQAYHGRFSSADSGSFGFLSTPPVMGEDMGFDDSDDSYNESNPYALLTGIPDSSCSVKSSYSKPTGHQGIMTLQKAEGYWEYSGQLESQLGCKQAKDYCPKDIDDISIWITVLCLSYLQKQFQEYKSEWLLVYKKGERWVKSKMKNCKLSYEQLFDLATDFLKR
ncbi:Von Willebrand factor A domain-containing protein 5A-like [Oopsacas minuta]|uniref:von Willebrand factor A domain-containing protein 5A-like n=1 Tax=Oopsacas minuta TaxID=111878 RepID=A0AAV7K1T1_9METZ|nr:Von Willebrand factor A domain-containing protein 5A-like [Oopsacas minuta]